LPRTSEVWFEPTPSGKERDSRGFCLRREMVPRRGPVNGCNGTRKRPESLNEEATNAG